MLKIIDYKAGNAPSVFHAVARLGYDAGFARLPEDLAGAERIILPGVGSAGATMESLRETCMLEALEEAVLKRGIPCLGICVGLQILFDYSEEENTNCLGWLKGEVIKFDANRVRVPQIGWNKVGFKKSPLNEAYEDYFYFVNSYRAYPASDDDVWGVAEYDGEFTAAVRRDNIYASQFHMEKSGEAGLSLLNEFCERG
jgi:glutamine amidotransferase